MAYTDFLTQQAHLPETCNTPPVAVCQDVAVSANANCEGFVTQAQVDGGCYDPDGDPFTASLSSDGPFLLGNPVDVILTVTDTADASDSCTATVTVVDDTSPTAICVPGVNPSGNEPNADNQDGFFELGGEDNCGIATIHVVDSESGHKFGPFPTGTNFKYIEAPGAKIKQKRGARRSRLEAHGQR